MIGADLSAATFAPSLVRRPRATALGRNTHAVPDVRRLVEAQFHQAFPHRVWVAGQVGQTTTDAEGGVRFRLHSSQDEDPFWLPCVIPAETLPVLREMLGSRHDTDLEDIVGEGRLARAGGLMRFDAIRGGVALVISELDPEVTALGLAEDREQGFAAVRSGGLIERQRLRTPRAAIRTVGVVRGPDDAAAARVRERLADAGYAITVRDLPVPLHGVSAPSAVAQGVREASLVSDVVLVVRDRGRPLGLAVFDSEQVIRAVADALVPVVTGLGGPGDSTVCDEVAFVTLPTADDAAEWVLDRLRAGEGELHALRDEVAAAAAAGIGRAQDALGAEQEAVRLALVAAEPRVLARARLRWQVVLALAVLLAAGLVVAAVLLARPVLLAGLVVAVAAPLLLQVWSRHVETRGRRHMDLGKDDFAQVLEQLRRVRDELAATSSPEAVQRLRDTAAQLVERGEHLLHGPPA